MADIVEKTQEQIDNQLWVVMLERMLQEKYGRIQYLAIQPAPDPTITQINNDDLAWLLSEKDRCAKLEQQTAELQGKYNELSVNYQHVVNTRMWRCRVIIGRVARKILSPFRKLIHALKHN